MKAPSSLILAAAALLGAACTSPRKLQSVWPVTITHVGANAYSSAVFAMANEKLQRAVSDAFAANVECFIVPRQAGYDIVVLSVSKLKETDEMKLRRLIDTALDEAEKGR